MIIREIETLTEAQVVKKINDPKIKKMVNLAMQHDHTLPRHMLAKLGKHPSDDATMQLLSDIIDNSLSRTNYGDISREGKYDQWLVRQYANGAMDYEDLTGEGADVLGAFKALGVRGLLRQQHQDINRFRTLRQLISLFSRQGPYQDYLRRLQDEEKLKKMKRDKRDLVLINDDKYYVAIPFNYGACYYFNNAEGVQASFCTGSSTSSWFGRYASDGPMIDVFDKNNPMETIGKYQIHAPTSQIKSADQGYSTSRDEVFAKYYPGLLKKICDIMLAKQDQIHELSKEIQNDSGQYVVPKGYNVPEQVNMLKTKFPISYNSRAKNQEPEPESEPEVTNTQPEERGQEGLRDNPNVTWAVVDGDGNRMMVRARNTEDAIQIARRNAAPELGWNGRQLRANPVG